MALITRSYIVQILKHICLDRKENISDIFTELSSNELSKNLRYLKDGMIYKLKGIPTTDKYYCIKHRMMLHKF